VRNKNQSNQWAVWIGVVALCFLTSSCKPDDSPFRAESDSLRKQLAKQESVVTSLQDGNKVMQQQIDLLNQELRDAKKSAESARTDAKTASENLAMQSAQAKKLTAEVQKTAAAQAALNIHIDEKGTQIDEIPRPINAITKIAEEALGRNGYHIKVSIKTDQKAIYVTERKVSPPTSLEVAGSRNQYVVSLQALPSNVTRLSVKADFEKLAQGGRILSVSAEEVAEIERSLIREINKALSSPSKT
jgi:TolA-binding protein